MQLHGLALYPTEEEIPLSEGDEVRLRVGVYDLTSMGRRPLLADESGENVVVLGLTAPGTVGILSLFGLD